MKLHLLLLMLPAFAYCQDTYLKGDTLVTSSGFKVYRGQKLKMGKGSTPDGDFKYIRRSATSLFNNTSTYHAAANSSNALPRRSSQLEYEVVRIDERGSKKHGYVYYPIIGTGFGRYEIDIDNAIEAGELQVPNEYKPQQKNNTVVVNSQLSLADELAKLKKLYDDGTLNKEEYEAAKKKLLEKN